MNNISLLKYKGSDFKYEELQCYKHDRIKLLIENIKSQFTDENAKLFFSKYWRDKRKSNGIVSTGFCYLASHAFYQLVNDNHNYVIKKYTPEDEPAYGHFWIEDIRNNSIIDITSDQFINGYPYYNKGKSARIKLSDKIENFISLVNSSLR